jgi:hypothetical protein
MLPPELDLDKKQHKKKKFPVSSASLFIQLGFLVCGIPKSTNSGFFRSAMILEYISGSLLK